MNLIDLKPGQVYQGIVKIVGKRVPGPTVIRITDGSFTLEAVGKAQDFELGDVVELTGPALRRLGKVQIEIKTITKSSKPLPIQDMAKDMDTNLVVSTPFNEKLRPKFIEAALRIRGAIMADQPVILRHHADADGVSGAILVEKALQDLCRSRGMKPEQYVYRMPSKVPFYDVADAIWDVSFTRRVIEQRGLPQPLIVNIDNGSTEEDRFALKLMHAIGFPLVVIDHHNPGVVKDGASEVDQFLDVHVNPILLGGTYWSTSAMLCYEIAHFINPKIDLKALPAISAVSDRSESEEGKKYMALSGMSHEELRNLAICFDFLSYHLRNDSATVLFDEVLSNQDLVSAIVEEVKMHVERQIETVIPHAELHKFDSATLAVIDLSKSGDRFGFPPAGKLTGQVHDRIKAENPGVLLTLGILPGLIIIRETAPLLPVKKIIDDFQKSHPKIHVSGGGHDVAGTIKCPSDATPTVIEFVKNALAAIPK